MWDIIFADVSGAFETPHQTGPLDLATDTFYRARKEEIECRLLELKDTQRAVEILQQRDERERESKTWCVGVRWDICEREDLIDIVKVRDLCYLHRNNAEYLYVSVWVGLPLQLSVDCFARITPVAAVGFLTSLHGIRKRGYASS